MTRLARVTDAAPAVRPAAVLAAAAGLGGGSDGELRRRADALRGSVPASGRAARAWCRDAAALAVEAVRRDTGLTLRAVQVFAGLTVAAGRLAEMNTGEGKTLSATVPCVLFALAGRRVHVQTPNAYLAERDHATVAGSLARLGVTAALLPESASGAGEGEKRTAYAADVIYGTGYEFGFDFLRDQSTARARRDRPAGAAFLAALRGGDAAGDASIQGPLDVAVVDEADGVLIDEANTPLLLGAPPSGEPVDPRPYRLARFTALKLEEGVDYVRDPAARTVRLTDAGLAAVGPAPPGRAFPLSRPWPVAVERALHAEFVLARDADYVLAPDDDGTVGVRIVDPNTGRVFTERTWRDGLHQAVEAKEAAPITEETRGLARVARHRFFGRYATVCGMTGTAAEAAREFRAAYGLPVVKVPPHRPSRREDLPARYFPTREDRTAGVVAGAVAAHRAGRPVLIGTTTVAAGRAVSAALADAGLEHAVLDGLQDAAEADLVAAAGRSGAVTVATDMAGRGTDIKPDPAALAAGGLCVLACERHAGARVDRQLAGRAGRQGDPGSARFFLSADDDLLARHAPRLAARMSRFPPSGRESPALDRAVRRLQATLERRSAEARRQLTAADDRLGGVLDALAA